MVPTLMATGVAWQQNQLHFCRINCTQMGSWRSREMGHEHSCARVRSAIRTRTDALGAVEAGSTKRLIRATNARLRRAELPRSGSRWRIRGGLGR